MPGAFISFEGLDGCGKSTQISLAEDYLRRQGLSPLVTREPGGCRISEQIRTILLDRDNKHMDPHAEALLYAAARAQHLQEVIRPALDAGRVVLCDRFVDSSLAYQGAGRGLGADEVMSINRWALGDTMPDLTIFLDCPPSSASQRRQKTHSAEDRIEAEGERFYERLYWGFIDLCGKYPDRIVRVNSSGTVDEVQARIESVLKDVLKRKGIVVA